MTKVEHYRLSEEIPLAFGQIREQIDQLPDVLRNLLVTILTEASARIPSEFSPYADNACEILLICGRKGPISEGVRAAIAIYPDQTKINSQVGLPSAQERIADAPVLSDAEVKQLEIRIFIGLGKSAARIACVVAATPELVIAMDDFCGQKFDEVIRPAFFTRENLAKVLANLNPVAVVRKIAKPRSKK